ncbi:hypothetical protein HER32_03990 [Hymenobacter sp. BT18]|uniref:hypothetical protein n=1 Tax=Hymenobacter sp. BT18 TaxID=2835648 RepID=UPI00143E5205|nr:hypothetical protein [Hymenobacter sp. BT18]QIX60392.1 hypothetical protein HER32_03990 [Hymenobacter sp. BT18]
MMTNKMHFYRNAILIVLLVFVNNNVIGGSGADRYVLNPDGETSFLIPASIVVIIVFLFVFFFVVDLIKGNGSVKTNQSSNQSNINKITAISNCDAPKSKEEIENEKLNKLIKFAEAIRSSNVVGVKFEDIKNSYGTLSSWREDWRWSENINDYEIVFVRYNLGWQRIECFLMKTKLQKDYLFLVLLLKYLMKLVKLKMKKIG